MEKVRCSYWRLNQAWMSINVANEILYRWVNKQMCCMYYMRHSRYIEDKPSDASKSDPDQLIERHNDVSLGHAQARINSGVYHHKHTGHALSRVTQSIKDLTFSLSWHISSSLYPIRSAQFLYRCQVPSCSQRTTNFVFPCPSNREVSNYRLTSAGARPHLTHDFTKSSITNNFLNINLININLAFLDSQNLIY